MKLKKFFRFRPRSRAQAATKDRPLLTRDQGSRYYLRRRDKEPSKGRGVFGLRDEGRPSTREELAATRALIRERRERERQMYFASEMEEAERIPMHQIIREEDQARHSVCQARAIRQGVLFATGIAGKKKSPGKGGTYKRTATSSISCERSL